MTRPGFGPAEAPPEDLDPVEAWLRRARCCGAPQMCGAVCMDDERSQTEAAVVRRLDDAEAACQRVGALAAEYEAKAEEAEQAAATFLRRDDAHVDLIRRANANRATAIRLRGALTGEGS